MNYKKTNASKTTISRDVKELSQETDNIYKTISILSKRAKQIGLEMKEELLEKIDEFATTNNSLEEVFENKEQIEVSKYYERLPKSTSIAIQEMLEGNVYHREPELKEVIEFSEDELSSDDVSSNESVSDDSNEEKKS
tara:strand:+ start:71 stop:484 length:414 start_codon:yes stop_codon:yes gene_type:complete